MQSLIVCLVSINFDVTFYEARTLIVNILCSSLFNNLVLFLCLILIFLITLFETNLTNYLDLHVMSYKYILLIRVTFLQVLLVPCVLPQDILPTDVRTSTKEGTD